MEFNRFVWYAIHCWTKTRKAGSNGHRTTEIQKEGWHSGGIVASATGYMELLKHTNNAYGNDTAAFDAEHLGV